MQEIKYILKFANINFTNLAFLLGVETSCLIKYMNMPEAVPEEFNKKINIIIDMFDYKVNFSHKNLEFDD